MSELDKELVEKAIELKELMLPQVIELLNNNPTTLSYYQSRIEWDLQSLFYEENVAFENFTQLIQLLYGIFYHIESNKNEEYKKFPQKLRNNIEVFLSKNIIKGAYPFTFETYPCVLPFENEFKIFKNDKNDKASPSFLIKLAKCLKLIGYWELLVFNWDTYNWESHKLLRETNE